jgi:hypothetical protein
MDNPNAVTAPPAVDRVHNQLKPVHINNEAIELCGLWMPLVVPIVFIIVKLKASSVVPIFLTAYGSGSLLVAAALITLTFLVTARKPLNVAFIIAIVLLMYLVQGEILSDAAAGGTLIHAGSIIIPESSTIVPTDGTILPVDSIIMPPDNINITSELFCYRTSTIWCSIIVFILVAAFRTRTLMKSDSFNEHA